MGEKTVRLATAIDEMNRIDRRHTASLLVFVFACIIVIWGAFAWLHAADTADRDTALEAWERERVAYFDESPCPEERDAFMTDCCVGQPYSVCVENVVRLKHVVCGGNGH